MQRKLLVPLIFLVSILSVCLIPQNPSKPTIGIVFATGAVDSYNNKISGVQGWQWNDTLQTGSGTGGYQQVFWVNWYDYTSGYYSQVEPNEKMYFQVLVLLNSTLASTPAEALARTKVYITLSGIWNNVEMRDYAQCMSETVGGMWYVTYREYWTTGPAANTQYVLSVQYQVKLSA
jgi:hypothetical protein